MEGFACNSTTTVFLTQCNPCNKHKLLRDEKYNLVMRVNFETGCVVKAKEYGKVDISLQWLQLYATCRHYAPSVVQSFREIDYAGWWTSLTRG
jgi:hypothetical protein